MNRLEGCEISQGNRKDSLWISSLFCWNILPVKCIGSKKTHKLDGQDSGSPHRQDTIQFGQFSSVQLLSSVTETVTFLPVAILTVRCVCFFQRLRKDKWPTWATKIINENCSPVSRSWLESFRVYLEAIGKHPCSLFLRKERNHYLIPNGEPPPLPTPHVEPKGHFPPVRERRWRELKSRLLSHKSWEHSRRLPFCSETPQKEA